jgi:carbohydrate-selective porin OprB
MPISNLEAPPFTQLSEFWLYQKVGSRLHLRLGKQDANRDFGSPRFTGNFINSAYGDFPGNPMPSFPAPGLGAVAFLDTTDWLQIRAGIYEGQPKIGSFGETAFASDAGAFIVTAGVFKQKWKMTESLDQIGIWTHTSLDRSGVFGIYDVMLHPHSFSDRRTVQLFIRAGWSPDLPEHPEEITSYIGGGITAHAFLGRNNTIGLGFGAAHTAQAGETFIESFFKLRTIEWFTFEPDLQYYFRADHKFLSFGIRTKLKL